MSKHETINQFKDGLMMDIHPLQTPNSVLTDCLNGTFITYNGNEHVLQNDMGNFKLEKCKLYENYIPIGTASYGDILYIASYNPIDKKFELGSYPSPLQWSEVGTEKNGQFTSILQNALANVSDSDNVPAINYSDIEQYSSSIVFDEKEYKLLPGDKYKITESNSQGPKIEATEYFILDERNVKHDITNEITINSTEPTPISWQIPGYFGMTSSVLTPKSHKMFLMSATTGPKNVKYQLRSVISIYDNRLLKDKLLNMFSKNISFEIQVLIEGDLYKTFKIGSTDCKQVNTIQWLYDKKQIIYEYTLDVNYDDAEKPIIDDGQLFYERPTEIYCIPVLNYIADGDEEVVNNIRKFDLKYDTLKSVVAYTANGKNKNTVAVDTFNWHIEEYEEDDETISRSELKITYDLFTSSEQTKLCVFYKTVESLLTKFELPLRPSTPQDGSNVCYVEPDQYGVVTNNDIVKFLDFEENALYVVFFTFTENDKLPEDAKFIARFLYTGKKSEQDGRADIKLDLQAEIDEYLEKIKAAKATYTLTELTSNFKGATSLFNYDPTIFTKTPISTNAIQTINCKSNVELVDENGETLIELVNDTKLPNFMQNIGINRRYSTSGEVNTYGSISNQFKYEFDVPINNTSSNPYYDFSSVKEFKKLNPNDIEPYNIYWITKDNKAQLGPMDVWVNDDVIMFSDRVVRYDKINQSHNHNVKKENVFLTTSGQQFNIVTIGVKKHNASSDHALMLYNAANARYLVNKDSSITQKTFLQVGYGSDWCLVQFDSGGNDNIDSLKNNIANLGYFIFKSNASGNWEQKRIYTYKMEVPDVGSQQYVLYEKVGYKTDVNNKMFNWIQNGSKIDELKCSSKSEFDKNSRIEKLIFNESGGHLLTVLFEDDSLKTHIAERIKDWNDKWEQAAKDCNPDPNNYTKYIEYSGHTIKDRFYLTSSTNDDTLKNFIKHVIPNRTTSKELATLDGNYNSNKRASFYFGNVSSGNTRRQVGYIDGFIQWLPTSN